MATINYRCDTCKRDVQLIENKLGLTTLGNCIITQNCRGSLYATKRNPNNLRESLPVYNKELDDYSPRKLFHYYEQQVPIVEWSVDHGFGPSCVIVVYDTSGNIIPPDSYSTSTVGGITTITHPSEISGYVHVISRIGGAAATTIRQIQSSDVQVSYNNIVTFAIPKYITRINSGSAPVLPPSVTSTPAPSQPALPSPAPFNACSANIRIEVEVSKPNEPTVTCVEQLDAITAHAGPWIGWNEILVRNRKHYCLRAIDVSKLKVFTNTNDQTVNIPDGAQLKITRIDYGTGLLVNIPDRGLLMLLAGEPFNPADKLLDKVIDCGEMVGANVDFFSFSQYQLYVSSDIVEATYPKIVKYNG